jgi:beta-glucosidase-like glycosyl hydrolase
MMLLLFITTLVLLLSAGGLWVYKTEPEGGKSDPWYPAPRGGTVTAWQEAYKKAAALVSQMTVVEKVNITTGTGWQMGMCVGNTGPVERLAFPSLCLQDGPLGLRFADNITAFPAGITLGSTWNKELIHLKGRAHGKEARAKGIHIALGPSMGPFGRLPAGGRNWEGFGADAVLQGLASAAMIRGIQEEGVIATAKHYIANEQEHFRQSWEWGIPNAISSNIDDRTLHEIYAWPFAESVRAGVASVMCSYNMLNQSYTCQNSKLLNGILKDEMGFQGFIQSDWLAQRSGVASALAGLDMSMPGDGLFWMNGQSLWGGELTKAVFNGSVPMERLDDMVLRIVAAWYQLGQDDKSKWPAEKDGGGPNFSSWTNDEIGLLHPGSNDSTTGVVNKFINVQGKGKDAHSKLAHQIAAEGTILLKNVDNVLPLPRDGKKLSKDGKSKLRVAIFGEDAYNSGKGPNHCPDRACNEGTLAQGWGSGTVEFPYLIAPAEGIHNGFDAESISLSDYPSNHQELDKHPSRATEQDLCFVFVNSDGGEGYVAWKDIKGDRNDLYAQKGGDDLVQQVASKCSGPTIVIVHSVGPVIMENWIDLPGVKAVIYANLPGQESGNALASIIFGDINPSGRLPYTIAKHEDDYGPTSKILRHPNGIIPQQNFSEGLYIDYRYFDKQGIEPRYEFGFGLSYTTFQLGSILIHPVATKFARLPASRPVTSVTPPRLSLVVPDAKEALWPKGFIALKKYIYPYIDSTDDVEKRGKYPYPHGYSITQPPSQAGGAQGGNPDLYTTIAVVQASLTNTGTRNGDCVVQLYISYPANTSNPILDSLGNAVDFPVRVLRAFEKVFVGTEKEEQVSLELTRKDLSFWDVGLQNWVLPMGEFEVQLGFSSRLIEQKGVLRITES